MHAPARSRIGRPIWGPPALLRDLELRLALSPIEVGSERLTQWSDAVKAAMSERAFFRRSFEADELGTSALLLEWRDDLVSAGWNGRAIGSPRIDDLAAIEACAIPLPIGEPDRLARVEAALTGSSELHYQSLALVDDLALWPGRWRNVFSLLARAGTALARHDVDVPWNGSASDLGILQARLRGENLPRQIRGDGSLVLLRGDTTTELAEVVAAMLAARPEERHVVVRSRDPQTLDAALARHGLARHGITGESAWRPAMQVLPLALELAFEPRDPHLLLELLTLSVGPFRGTLGAKLARAVARQPGTGGHEWRRQKSEAVAHLRAQAAHDPKAAAAAEIRIARVETWLERPGASGGSITRAALQATVERVHGWLQNRIATTGIDTYGAALTQAATFSEVVRHSTRNSFTREEVLRLFDRFARTTQQHALAAEEAGRSAHVIHPGSILDSCDNVFFWTFIGGIERRPVRLPWRNEELAALVHHRVFLVRPQDQLRADAEAWRRAVLAAHKRAVFVFPAAVRGVASVSHPFWDEVRARLGLDDHGAARITRSAADVVRDRGRPVPPLALPARRASWTVAPDMLARRTTDQRISVTALERIASCPLAWVFEHVAVLRSGAMSKIATGGLLNGGLAHRLVEVLHHDRAFELDERGFVSRAQVQLEELIRREGATLLVGGNSNEKLQLTRQIIVGVRALHRYILANNLRIVAVEEEISAPSALGPLHGRIDLRLADHDGRPAILDLKWGSSAYRTLLEQGRAVQLAVYARAVPGDPPAAYFALARGTVLSADSRLPTARQIVGPTLESTLRRVEKTALAVLDSHARGVVHAPAAGKGRETLLLDALGIPVEERELHHDAPSAASCQYCEYDALCGRRWRSFA